MSPYRTPSRERPEHLPAVAKPWPVFELALLLLSGFRVVVAGVAGERCGGEVGLATVLGLFALAALIAARWRRRDGTHR